MQTFQESNYSQFPDELKQQKAWVVWKLEPNEKGKLTKPPYVVADPDCRASSIDPIKWSSFENAVEAYTNGFSFDGIGVMVTDGYTFIDLDHCRNKETGEIAPWAQAIIKRANSYSEISPSNEGIHIFLRGSLQKSIKKNSVEMYSRARYLTVTGRHLEGTPLTINPFDAESLRADVANAKAGHVESAKSPETVPNPKLDNSDSGKEFRLMLNIIRELNTTDEKKIDTEFRKRGTYRSKWDELHSGVTYTIYSIRNAFRFLDKSKPTPQSLGAAAVEVVEETVETVEPPLAEFPVLPGSIHEFATNLDPDVPYAFKAISAVVRIGLALSNFVHLADAPNIQPRLFAAIVADAGRGKTAANEQTGDHLNPLIQATVISSMDSGPNLVATFKTIELDNQMKGIDAPPKLLLDPDELKDLFEKAKESKDSRNSLFGELLKLFENNRTANCTKKDGNIIVENAHLAFIGGATPSGYERMWTKTGGSQGGLMSRVVVVGSDTPKLPPTRRPSDLNKVKAAVDSLAAQISKAAKEHLVITITPEASQMLDEWWGSIQDDAHAIRLTDTVKRFLMVLAVTNGTTVIDTELMGTGIAFGQHVLSARKRYNPDDSASYVQAFENRIIAAFKRHPLMSERQCQRCINPAKYDGGYDTFNKAWAALVRAKKVIQRERIGKRQMFSLDDYER